LVGGPILGALGRGDRLVCGGGIRRLGSRQESERRQPGEAFHVGNVGPRIGGASLSRRSAAKWLRDKSVEISLGCNGPHPLDLSDLRRRLKIPGLARGAP